MAAYKFEFDKITAYGINIDPRVYVVEAPNQLLAAEKFVQEVGAEIAEPNRGLTITHITDNSVIRWDDD